MTAARARRAAAGAALLLLLAPAPGRAADGSIGTWAAGLYGSPPRAAGAPAGAAGAAGASAAAPQGACLAAALDAARRHGVPDHVIVGVALTESGRSVDGGPLTAWPWTVNVHGEGRWFETREAALRWVRESLAAGKRSIDVGCMQVNLRWHPDAFPDLETAFDPAANVEYAARHLASLRAGSGGWDAAVGRYHSADPARAARYRAAVGRNMRFAEAAREYVASVAAAAAPGAPPAPRFTLSWADWFAGRAAERGATGIYGDLPLQPVLPPLRAGGA